MRTDLENIEDVDDRRAGEVVTAGPIPVSQWGNDHWSTLAFVAHWCAELGADGFDISIRLASMRTDPDRHPQHVGNQYAPTSDDLKYPTRLARGLKLPDHDDWDCLDDAEAAGMVEIEGTGLHPIFKMTDEGLDVAARLVAHKTRGGSFGDFEVRVEEMPDDPGEAAGVVES